MSKRSYKENVNFRRITGIIFDKPVISTDENKSEDKPFKKKKKKKSIL